MKEELLKREESLSPYAFKSKDASRLKPLREDVRPAFFRDIDRIIYTKCYSRYMNKTQVFSYTRNDHVTTRMVHVQLVSKIARTIGRLLNLNEDLIEAASLGHDLGHTPLGHLGESILNKICQEEMGEYFHHNIQSVRLLMEIENKGKGCNLTLQVLDAIMCHNGESLKDTYAPRSKTKEEFLDEYHASFKKKNFNHVPMTLEGCVLLISDVIAYIGRDIEDAIRVKIIKESDIPESITSVLGSKNKDIVNTLILDIIKESKGHNYIKMSPKVYKALKDLMAFNYEYIYNYAETKENKIKFEQDIRNLFHKYLDDLEKKNMDSLIYKDFLDNMDETYLKNTSLKRIVIDFISGMTDNYLKERVGEISEN